MEESEILDYVKAAAVALDLPLDAARAQAVAQHFGRSVAIARVLDDAPLAPEHELAEIYRPCTFPGEDSA